ncbi:MAG: class I SAM-dependent methyltransferase [Bacteroidia bacterium]
MEYSVKTSELKNQAVADKFYEERYREGYMDEWPEWKKLRIIEIIHELNLPETGKALDFGCGRGIFTQVLKRALPQWEITGCDISQVAMDDAKLKFPDCKFSSVTELHARNSLFDLIFSHHVLEHVADIEESIHDISKLQASGAVMLHVLPCGNAGSLEHDLASTVPGGINKELGNRFYFEDIGHMRRINSDEMDAIFNLENYKPLQAWFANHKYGSLEWMSDYPEKYINESITNLKLANGDKTIEKKLLKLRADVAKLKAARQFAKEGSKHRVKTRLIEIQKNVFQAIPKAVSIFTDLQLVKEGERFNQNLANEWLSQKHVKSGSEMYLAYIKNS